MRGEPLAGQLRKRHLRDRVRLDVVTPVLLVRSLGLRPDQPPVDHLGTAGAETLGHHARLELGDGTARDQPASE
jgi:hypothetical protein